MITVISRASPIAATNSTPSIHGGTARAGIAAALATQVFALVDVVYLEDARFAQFLAVAFGPGGIP